MNKPISLFLFFLGFSLTISSCQVFDNEEGTPSWLVIDSVLMTDNPAINEGSLSQDIRDVWISVDDNRFGTFELPARIPLLEEGLHEIVISAGIFVSGISSLRTDYIYYKKDTYNLDLQPGETNSLLPVFTYMSSDLQQIQVIEDFEDGDIRMSVTQASNTQLTRTSDNEIVKYGNACGKIQLNDTVTAATLRTNGTIILPQGGASFLEMDILSDYSITVGLYVNSLSNQSNGLDIVTFKPTENKWKKFYVALDQTLDEAYVLRNPESFYAYFRTEFGASTQPRDGVVLIDNVKILFVK